MANLSSYAYGCGNLMALQFFIHCPNQISPDRNFYFCKESKRKDVFQYAVYAPNVTMFVRLLCFEHLYPFRQVDMVLVIYYVIVLNTLD